MHKALALVPAIFLSLAVSAQATSVSTIATQVNVVPGAGYYQPRQAAISDLGSGRFMVFWSEDNTDGFPNLSGNKVKSRGFQLAGAGFSQFKAAGFVSPVNPAGSLALLGVHRTTNSDMHPVWSQTSAAGLTSLYKQVFRAGNKLGANVTLVSNIIGGSARLVVGRTDKVSALVWRVNSGIPNHVGKIMSQVNGNLTTPIGFNLDPGELLLRTEGVGTTFVATASSFDTTFTKWRIRGRSFSSTFAMSPTAVLLQNFIELDKAPWMQIATRTDGQVVLFSSLKNAGGKLDMRAQRRTVAWGVIAPAAVVGPNLPADTQSGPVTARLPAAGLLTAQRIKDGSGFSIFIKRYNANMVQVGATAKIGPVPEIQASAIELLSTGKAVIVYVQGKQIFVRQVTP